MVTLDLNLCPIQAKLARQAEQRFRAREFEQRITREQVGGACIRYVTCDIYGAVSTVLHLTLLSGGQLASPRTICHGRAAGSLCRTVAHAMSQEPGLRT